MSTLQCPATLLLVDPGHDLAPPGAERRIAHVWAPPRAADRARGLAARLQVGSTVLPELAVDGPAGPDGWREALGEVADRTPGETTVVLALDEGLRAALPAIARTDLTADQLAAAGVIELAVDADGWTCRSG